MEDFEYLKKISINPDLQVYTHYMPFIHWYLVTNYK